MAPITKIGGGTQYPYENGPDAGAGKVKDGPGQQAPGMPAWGARTVAGSAQQKAPPPSSVLAFLMSPTMTSRGAARALVGDISDFVKSAPGAARFTAEAAERLLVRTLLRFAGVSAIALEIPGDTPQSTRPDFREPWGTDLYLDYYNKGKRDPNRPVAEFVLIVNGKKEVLPVLVNIVKPLTPDIMQTKPWNSPRLREMVSFNGNALLAQLRDRYQYDMSKLPEGIRELLRHSEQPAAAATSAPAPGPIEETAAEQLPYLVRRWDGNDNPVRLVRGLDGLLYVPALPTTTEDGQPAAAVGGALVAPGALGRGSGPAAASLVPVNQGGVPHDMVSEGSGPSAPTSGKPAYSIYGLDRTLTDEYRETRNILQSQRFAPHIDPLVKEIAALMNEPNLGPALGAKLDELRSQLNGSDFNAILEASRAKYVLVILQGDDTGMARKAAALTFLTSLYRIEGGEDEPGVWLYNPPVSLRRFPLTNIDLIPDDPIIIRQMLGGIANPFDPNFREELQFASGHIAEIAKANRQAQAWVDEVVAKLKNPDERTLSLVDKWFNSQKSNHAGTHDDVELPVFDQLGVIEWLRNHFKLVSEISTSRGIIFSDHPPTRYVRDYGPNDIASPLKQTLAMIMSPDNFPVVYLLNKFDVKQGPLNRGLARTIFHEKMHLNPQVGEDFRYVGLEPGHTFPTEDALCNAENLLSFALDSVGEMSDEEISKALSE
jgi:hypothetical protein